MNEYRGEEDEKEVVRKEHVQFFRLGSFFSTLGAFPTGAEGAAPMVNRDPPAGCAGGARPPALNGDVG